MSSNLIDVDTFFRCSTSQRTCLVGLRRFNLWGWVGGLLIKMIARGPFEAKPSQAKPSQEPSQEPTPTTPRHATPLKRSTTTRFELARAEPIGFQVQLLNHSDTLSILASASYKHKRVTTHCLVGAWAWCACMGLSKTQSHSRSDTRGPHTARISVNLLARLY